MDGNTETKFRFGNESGSCTFTCLETAMWWMVDFGQTALVQSINITNRGKLMWGGGIDQSKLDLRDTRHKYFQRYIIFLRNWWA